MSIKRKYCPVCGWLKVLDENEKCPVCNTTLEYIPEEFLKEGEFKDDMAKERFIKHYIKDSSIFNPLLFEDADLIYEKKWDEIDLRMQLRTQAILASIPNTPKCPTCQSINIRRIDSAERGLSFALCGFFSNKINKSFECLNCGYTW